MLLLLFLLTTCFQNIATFEVGSGSGDEVSADVCRLPNGNFPNPDNCASFVICHSGEPAVEQCPDGLLFNPFIMTCDFSVTGACSSLEDFNSTSVPLPTNDIDCSTDNTTATNIYLIPSSCSDYYLCNNGAAFLVKCPSGLLMNSEKLTCDYEENVECDTTSITESSVDGMKAVIESNNEENIKVNTDSITESETISNTDSATQAETSTTTLESTLSTSTKSQFNVSTTSDDNIRTPSELNLTKDVTTEQASLKQSETSSSLISEYTVNQQSTDLPVSTEQTKEEKIKATSKTTSISSVTTESTLGTVTSTFGYITTIDEQATSSDTTNPYPDLTNTNDYFTQTNWNEQSESQTDSVAITKSGNATSQEKIATTETKTSSDIAATEFFSISTEPTVAEKSNDTKVIEEEYIVVDQTTKLEEKGTDPPYRSTLANDTKTNLNSVKDFESSSPVTMTEITSTVMSSSILSIESTKERIASVDSSPTTHIEQFATTDQTDRISPEKTISTVQSLMSSDPSTDETNENITSSKYSTFTELTGINTESSTDLTALSSTNELPDKITIYTEATTMNVEKQTDVIQSSVSDVQEDTSVTRSTFDVSNESSTVGTLENSTSDTLVTESQLLTVYPTTNEPNITIDTHTNEDLSTKVSSNLPVTQTDTDSGISVDLSSKLTSSSTTESASFSDIISSTAIKISTDMELTSTKETPTTLAEQTTPVSETLEVQKTTFPSPSSVPASDTAMTSQQSTPTSVSFEKVTTQINDVDLTSTEKNTKKNADDIFTPSTLSSREFSDFSGSGTLDDETTQTPSSDYSTVTKLSTQSTFSSKSNTDDDTNVKTGIYDSSTGQSDDVQNSTLSTDNQETSTISINSFISETTAKQDFSSSRIIDFETTSENFQSTYKTENDISDSSLTSITSKRFPETDEHEITDLNTKTSTLSENEVTEQTKSSDEIPTSASNVYASSTTENYTFVPTLPSDAFTFDSTTESKSTGFSGITDLTTNMTNFDDMESTVITTKFRDATSTISSEGVSDITFSTIPSVNFDGSSEKTNTQPNITTNTGMSSADEKISSTVQFETSESTSKPDASSVTVFESTTQNLESKSTFIQGSTSFITDESTIGVSNSSPAIADEITSNEEKSTYVSTTDTETSSVLVTDLMSSTKIRDFDATSESTIMKRSTLEQTTSNEADITSKITTNTDLTFANETTPTPHYKTPEDTSSIVDFENTTDDFASSSTSLTNSVSFNTDESTTERTSSSMIIDNITHSEENSTSKSTAEFETTSNLVTDLTPSIKVTDFDFTITTRTTLKETTSDKADITTNTDPTFIDETTSTAHFETSKSISESNTPSTVDLEITTEEIASSSTSFISSISFNTDESTTEYTSSSMIMDNITNSEEKSTSISTDEFETTNNLVTEFRPSTKLDLDVTSGSTIMTRATSDKTDITEKITTNTDPTFTDETTSTAHFETSKSISESNTPSTVDLEITTEEIASSSTSLISSISFNTDESTTEYTSSSMIMDNITNSEEKSTSISTDEFETTNNLVTEFRPSTKVDLDVTSGSTIMTRATSDKTDITEKITTNTDPTFTDETTSTAHFETSKSISESNTPSTVDLEITTEEIASSSTSLISSISFNTDESTTEYTSSSMIIDNITNSEEKSTSISTDEFETTSNLVTEFKPSTKVDLDVTSESTIMTRVTSDKTDVTEKITTNTDPTFTDETTSTAHFETSKSTSESNTPSTVDFEVTTEDIAYKSTSFISSISFNTDESTTERASSSMIIGNITNNEENSTPKSTADFETTSILVTDSRPDTKVTDLDVTSESTITTRIALEKTTTELLEETSVTIDSSSITSSPIFDSASESTPEPMLPVKSTPKEKTFFPDNLITESTTVSNLDFYTANTTLDVKDNTDKSLFTVTDLTSLNTKDSDSSPQGKTDSYETSESTIITTALEETSKSNFDDETTLFTTTESSAITSTINSDNLESTSESSTSKFTIDQKTTPANITSETNIVITDDSTVDLTTLTSSPAHFDDTSEIINESTVFKEETTGLSDLTTLTTSSSSTTSIIDNISNVTDGDFTGKYSTAVETSSSAILTSEDLKTDDYSLITESTSTDKIDFDSTIVKTQTEGITLKSTSSAFSDETLSTRISDISSTVQSDHTSKRERMSTISKSFETTPYDTTSPKTETMSDLETSTSKILSSTILNTEKTSTDLTETFPTPKITSRRVTEFETSVSDIITESSITALSSKYGSTEGIITITDQNSIENLTTISSTTKESTTTDNEDEAVTESQVIPTTVKFSATTTTLNPICLKPNGFFPNPDDCKTFYQCSKGVPKLSNCIGNNHFSPISNMCEDRCQAKCEPSADCPTTEGETSSDGTTVASTTSRDKSISSTSVSETTETEGSSESTTDAFEIQKSTSEPDELSSTTDSKTIISDITSSFISTSSSTSEIETTNYVVSSSVTEESSISSDSTTKESTSVLNLSTTETSTASVPFYILSSTSGETTSFASIDDTTTKSYVTDSPTSKSPLITKTTVKISTTREYTEQPSSESVETSSESVETSSESVETSSESEDSSSSRSHLTTITQTTKCKNKECLSSKVPALSSTPLPFILCNRNDFVSRPQCNEYMDCTERYPKKKVCPMGLHFNPTSRVCDWPYIAGCGKIPNPLYVPDTSFTCPCRSCLVPSTTSCSKYYLCLGYTPYHMKCSNNLFFDTNLMTCNYAAMVKCFISISSTTVSTKKPTTISTTKSTTTRRPATTAKEPSTTSKPQGFACPRREGLFKYPGNCGKFYQCSNWFPYEMRCAPSTHFSEISNRCEWPCDAKCDPSLSCGASLKHSTVAPRDPQCSCLNCKLPSPETCTKYIVCTKGRARIENCPRGQTFEVKRSHCDWAHKVKCSHSEMCPERNGLFPHKDDCHKFVHCSNGIPYVKKCPYILEFDSVKRRCEWPNGRCNNSPATKEFDIFKAEEHKEGWECPKTFGYFSDDVHCNRFYRCSQGTPALKECSKGLLYNPRLQTCDWKGHVRCNSHRHQTPKRCRVYDRNLKCPSDRNPQPHTLCSMYYDCTDGRACAKQCPVGLYFNRKTGMCDLPANVKCFLAGEEEYSLKEFSSSCQSSSHHKRIANPTDDTCFYYCRQGKVISDCCSRSHVYNEHKDKCERRTKSFRL